MAKPATTWGWHRLDHTWAEQLVREAGVGPGHLVLDVGAGDGALTAPLAASGARVIAFELHPARAAVLRQRFDGERVRVVRVDAADLRLPRRPFHVVANPPWSITSRLVRRLVHPGSRLVRADLVVQRAAAHRWAEMATPHHRIEVGGLVPRRAFPPAPHDAAVLRIERRP